MSDNPLDARTIVLAVIGALGVVGSATGSFQLVRAGDETTAAVSTIDALTDLLVECRQRCAPPPRPVTLVEYEWEQRVREKLAAPPAAPPSSRAPPPSPVSAAPPADPAPEYDWERRVREKIGYVPGKRTTSDD